MSHLIRCPRCKEFVDSDASICRVCGGIIDENTRDPFKVTDDATPEESPSDEPLETPPETNALDDDDEIGDGWICLGCGQRVPDNFDICWSCQRTPDEGKRCAETPETPTPDTPTIVEEPTATVVPTTPEPAPRTVHEQVDEESGWEYRTVSIENGGALFSSVGAFDAADLELQLNRLGWDGWELVNVFDTNAHEGRTRFVIAVFKRRLTPERRAWLLNHSQRR